jgi:transcriptional regulator with XRE-family HTH domain
MKERTPVFRGTRLKERRMEYGLTQEELGVIIKTGKGNQVNRYENGKSTPTVEILYRIAEALNVSTDFLLGLSDFPSGHYLGGEDITPSERRLITVIRRSNQEMRELVRVLLSSLSATLGSDDKHV